MSDCGRQWPGESRAQVDEKTGARLWQMTDRPCINHTLYFLTDSFLPDERSLVFTSYRTGEPNFFSAGFPEGPVVQLTDEQGINGFSAILTRDGRRLLFTQGSRIMALNMDDHSLDQIADFPGGKLGEVDLSADERWVVSAVRLEREFGIGVASLDDRSGRIIHRQQRTIIHPQFHPADPTLIEYAADPAPRMHTIRSDGSDNRCLFEHDNNEFVVHETWLGETGDLVFTVWPYALKRMKLPGCEISTIAEFNAWHICPSADGRYILCDTNHPDIGLQWVDVATGERKTVCHSQSSNGGSQWTKTRYAVKEDFEAAARAGGSDVKNELSWMEMKTDTIYGPQWTHPHPALSASGRYATFTSDRTGQSQVYVVEMPA